MRIAASQLYANVYPRLDQERRANAQRKFKKLSVDDTPMVRWGAAQAMSTLVESLDNDVICEFILPLLRELLLDKNDSVKVHAVSSAVKVVSRITDQSKVQEQILPALKQAY